MPTRDSAAVLGRLLESVEKQGVSLEVIIVDQASADGTREAAAAAGATVVDTPRPALYAPPTQSRNAGAAAARSEFLVHLDADMALASGMLGAAVAACRKDGHVAVTLEEIDVTAGFWADCKALERRTYRESPILEGARFVRADVFDEVGGYDESLGSGEDWDIHARYAARGSIGRLADAVYHDLGSISFRDQVSKKFEYGRSALPFLQKQGSADFSRAMVSSYLRSWRLFAGDPAHTLGFLALRLGEASALGAGIALQALERRARPRTKPRT